MGCLKMKQVHGLIDALEGKANEGEVLKTGNNLSDVNAATARNNLDTYSKSEVQALVAGADEARNFATVPAWQAAANFRVSERIFVENDGDGKWALYIVTATTNGTYAGTTFKKVSDEDILNNALTAAQIKAAYESNANTNAFTDAEKQKLAFLTVTQALNLDTMKSDITAHGTAITTAQNTANTAQAIAGAASTAAGNAIDLANQVNTNLSNSINAVAASKKDNYAEAWQEFNGFDQPEGEEFQVELEQTIMPDSNVIVYINGIAAEATWDGGNNIVTINPCFYIESDDLIKVYYKYQV